MAKYNAKHVDFSHLQISCSFPRSLVLFWQFSQTHRIHGAGIYANIYHQYTPNVSIYTIHGSYGKLRKQLTPSHWPQSQCRRLPASLSSTVQVPSTLGVVEFRRGTQRGRVVAKLCCRLAEIPKIAEPKHLRKGTLRGRMCCVNAIRCHSNSVPTLAPCNVACMSSLAREASNHGVLSGSPVGHMFCAGIYAPPQSGHTTCQHAPTCRDPTCYNPFGHHVASSIQ